MILMLFFRLDFCHFSLCRVSFVIATGCEVFQKIISFVIPFFALYVALDCGLAFFQFHPLHSSVMSS